jgi:hypothetical protein
MYFQFFHYNVLFIYLVFQKILSKVFLSRRSSDHWVLDTGSQIYFSAHSKYSPRNCVLNIVWPSLLVFYGFTWPAGSFKTEFTYFNFHTIMLWNMYFLFIFYVYLLNKYPVSFQLSWAFGKQTHLFVSFLLNSYELS